MDDKSCNTLAPEQATCDVDPGTGYRLLSSGDVIQEGDQYYSAVSGGWIDSNNHGLLKEDCSLPYYRRKKLPAIEAVTAGDGYRLLATGETIRKGDELWEGSHWEASCLDNGQYEVGWDDACRNPFVYRRKLPEPSATNPGDGYRLLSENEAIQDGDQYFSYARQAWRDTKIQSGRKVGASFLSYRRKLQSAVPPEDALRDILKERDSRIADLEGFHVELKKLHSEQATIIRNQREAVAECHELRQGDFELVRNLAEDAGITLTAPDNLPGVQWEQFHDGVMLLANRRGCEQVDADRRGCEQVDADNKSLHATCTVYVGVMERQKKEIVALRAGNAILQSQTDGLMRCNKQLVDGQDGDRKALFKANGELAKDNKALRAGNAVLQSQCEAGTKAHRALRNALEEHRTLIEQLRGRLARVQEAVK